MGNKLTEVNSREDAYQFVNERFFFTPEHYPILEKFDDQERLVFSVNHLLLHMQKSLYDFLHLRDADWKGSYLTFTAKMMVNLTKLSEVMGIPQEEYVQSISNGASVPWGENMMIQRMGLLATECESFDHGKGFDHAKARQHVKDMLNLVFSLCGFETINHNPYSFNEVLSNIPNVMKSK